MPRRKNNIPKRKPTYAIVVDGKTEFWYLSMFKRVEKSVRINIEPRIPQKKPLSEQYKLVKSLVSDYKKVFWIIDLDVVIKETHTHKRKGPNPMQELIRFKNEFKKNPAVNVIVNSPCLEYWLLLHFEYTTKPFGNCKQAQTQLKKKWMPDYEKTQKFYTQENNDIYSKLKPKLKTAISNSKKSGAFDPHNPIRTLSEMIDFFSDKAFDEMFYSPKKSKKASR